jgi:hypothetical protein
MGLREHIERQIREAFRQGNARGGARINIASRVNRVVVDNVGGGHGAASAEQNAPIVQQPLAPDDEVVQQPLASDDQQA